MSLMRRLRRGVRILANRRAADRDIADEVEQFLDEAAASLEATGMSPEQARLAARRELGSTTAVTERVRGYGWEHVVDTLLADIRYGLRQLRRRPGLTAVAAATLALGIGASTAIFSAVNPVLLRSLPHRDAGRLLAIWDVYNGQQSNVTFGTFRELAARSRSFEQFAAMRPLQATLTGVAEPERLNGQYVSAGYFRLLGVQPALGRDFEASEDRPGAPFVAIISDALWRRRFGADRGIVGRQIAIEEIPVTVIGVLPREFENTLAPEADVWSLLMYDPSLPLNGREWGHTLRVVGRLAPGIPLDQARTELDAIARTALPDFPRAPAATLRNGLIVNPLQRDLSTTVRPALLAILGAVVLLLAIACVNVTNLLLARGAQRRAELTMRAALGASRLRLIRQLLTETLLLAALGGILGIAIAHLIVDVMVGLSPPGLPRVDAIQVDRAALVFGLALTTLVGLVVGIVPAVKGPGGDIRGGLQERSPGSARHRLVRSSLVVVQVALAFVLLVGAGLLVRSLSQLFAVPPGFEPANLLTMQVQTAGRRFIEVDASNQFFTQVLQTVHAVPGVSSAAFTTQLPMTGDEDIWGVHFEAIPASTIDEPPDAYRYVVSPGYFETMRIPLRKGRVLTSRDAADAPLTAVINESFARRRLPGLDPIGQRVRIGPGPWHTVVGVVGDVKHTSLATSRSDILYVPAAQWRVFADQGRWLVVRTRGDAASMTPAIREAIRSVDRRQPVLRVDTMEERLKASAIVRRFALALFEFFAAVAMGLAAIGTYSLLSGSVTERTREIGVRTALGASRRNIMALVLRQGMTLSAVGIVIGTAGAMTASGALATLLFGVSKLDVTTYVGVIALLAVVSAIACGLPALRAARLRPSIALRAD
jgi:putative ABC transport system permease protein